MRSYQRLNWIIGLFVLSIILSACSSIPSNAVCIPKEYPGTTIGEFEATKIFRSTTTDEYIQVIDFFRNELLFPPRIKNEIELVLDQWNMIEISDNKTLFECVSTLNWHEAEVGCVLVYRRGDKTIIETTWSFAEVGPAPCYVLPGLDSSEY